MYVFLVTFPFQNIIYFFHNFDNIFIYRQHIVIKESVLQGHVSTLHIEASCCQTNYQATHLAPLTLFSLLFCH